MSLVTIDDVKAIAGDDETIQAIDGTDRVFTIVDAYVTKVVTEAVYGELQFDAQLYLMAHMLSMSGQPVGGRGPLSSESIGGISQSFTLPWLNRTTVLGGTQFGIMHLEIRNQVVAAFRVITV